MDRFLQWNVRSARLRKPELIYLINKYKPVVAAISETWFKPDTIFRLPGYACFRDDRDDGWAGCALLIKKTIPYSLLPLPPHSCNFHVVAVRCSDISFVSIYIPHPSASIISELSPIFSSIPPPIIILGDFNCHHPIWGCPVSDCFSSNLIELMDDYNLCLLNDGSPTRSVSPLQNPSAVDLSFSSPSLASQLFWSVLPNSHGSDHFPILISTSFQNSTSPPLPPLLKYRLANADWNTFSSILDFKVAEFPPVDNHNYLLLYSKLVDAIIETADSIIPLKKTFSGIPSPPWWDSECTSAVKERNEAEKYFNANISIENYLLFKKVLAKSIRFLSKKKKNSWIKFCESLSPRSLSSIVWRKIKAFRNFRNDPRPTPTNDTSWLESFIDKLAPPFVPTQEYISSTPVNFPFSSMDGPFSFDELSAALNHLKDSAPGSDGIPYSFICRSSTATKIYFLSIINKIYENCKFPETWKHQIIIPILKPGKDPLSPLSYRPIALSSVMIKIFENLLKNRLEWLLEHREILSKSQFGFRKGFGTTHSLGIFMSDIRIAFSRNENLVAVFLDITGAYDNVLLHVLKQKMIHLNLPAKMTHVIFSLLTGRLISVRFQNTLSSPRLIWKGLPQGSVLSPLLYSLYTYDLHQSVDSFCEILEYADDIALYYASNSMSDLVSRLNTALIYLYEWLKNHGLSLASDKSKVVIFSRKKLVPDVQIYVSDYCLDVSNQAKFLGLILDSKLSGSVHIDYIRNKCEKNINILRALSGVWWGSHPYSQKLLYNAIIRSHLDYATFLLEPCSKISLRSLDSIQHKCLRIISGAMKSSPINALQVECVEAPLYLRRQFLSDRFFFQAAQFSLHPILNRLHCLSILFRSSDYWRHKDPSCLLNSFNKLSSMPFSLYQFPIHPLFSVPYDCLIYRPNILLHFGIDKDSPGADKIFHDTLNRQWPNWMAIFTDASKLTDNGSIGSAVWIPKFRIVLSHKCPPYSSVYSGESVALLEAVKYVESRKLNKSIIFSDSLSCLQDINKYPFRSKDLLHTNLKIREILYRCHSSGIEVALAWIPGHCGIEGNESVDYYAKQAVEIGLDTYSKGFSRDLRTLAEKNLREKWSEIWNRTRMIKGRHYGDIQPDIPVQPWFFKYKKSSKIVTSTIIRSRLGHVCSPVFLAKIRVRDHSLCECGLEDGTLDHIFFCCPKLSYSLYDVLSPDIPRPVSFKCLLSYVFTPFIFILCNFIKSNNIRL